MTNQEPDLLELSEDRVALRAELSFCYATPIETSAGFKQRAERDFGLIKKFVAKELESEKRIQRRQDADSALEGLELIYEKAGNVAVMRGFLEGLPEPQMVSLGRTLKRWCDDNMPGATPRTFDIPDRSCQKRRKTVGAIHRQITLPGIVEPPVLILVAPEPCH